MVERAGHRRAFAALARRLAPLDALIFEHSGGRLTILGPQGAGLPPTLLLTTTGRRTGRSRTTPVMYLTTDSGLAITSESFGQARPANWPQNLDADSHATAQIDDRARPYIARPATAEEVERLWPRFLAIWPAHQSYLDRSGVRRMFVLEPAKTRDSPLGRSAWQSRRRGRGSLLRQYRAAAHRLHLLRQLQHRLRPQREEQADDELPLPGDLALEWGS
jgi:deazaflavin-dependent oxidoreductase (nitroreductase family)